MSLSHQSKRSIFIGFLLGLFFPIVAFGEVGTKELAGIRLGILRFHPNFGVTQGYTDNAFLEHKNEKDSYWATFSPGLKMITPIGRQRLRHHIGPTS